MCQVSDKIKLCSCKTKNVEQLKHYWIIKRRNKDTSFIVGEIMMPAEIGEENHKINQDIILNQLNAGDIFDIEIHPNNNDILELHFTFKADGYRANNLQSDFDDYLAYAFKYKNGQWKKATYDNWIVNFDEIHKGKILSPFLRKYSRLNSK